MVADQRLSPTFTADLGAGPDRGGRARRERARPTSRRRGECSWFEFTEAIMEIAGIDVPIEPVEHHAPARRGRPAAQRGARARSARTRWGSRRCGTGARGSPSTCGWRGSPRPRSAPAPSRSSPVRTRLRHGVVIVTLLALACAAAGCGELGGDTRPERKTPAGHGAPARPIPARARPARAFLEWFRALQLHETRELARYYVPSLGLTADDARGAAAGRGPTRSIRSRPRSSGA